MTAMKKNTGSSMPNRALIALCRTTLIIKAPSDIPATSKNIFSHYICSFVNTPRDFFLIILTGNAR